MYHPIEEPEFDRKGKPVLDLSEDIHEFIELHNFSQETVTLDNWRISGGIDYAFPEGTSLRAASLWWSPATPSDWPASRNTSSPAKRCSARTRAF